jgi:hypothetical protein
MTRSGFLDEHRVLFLFLYDVFESLWRMQIERSR